MTILGSLPYSEDKPGGRRGEKVHHKMYALRDNKKNPPQAD